MSLRVRVGPADAGARAVFPAFGCPSGGLWYNSELEQPASTPHLVRCLRCASLNGRSALQCWSCEAELPAGLPVAEPSFVAGNGTDTGTEPDLGPPPHTPAFFGAPLGADLQTTPGAVHASSHADAPFFSAPSSAVAIEERLAAFSQQHRRRVPRRLLGAAAIAAFAAIAGAGAYLIQRPPPFIAMEADPARGQAALAVPEPQARAEPVTARLAGTSSTEPPPDAVRPDARPLANTEALEPAAQAAAPPTATPPSPVAALTAARGSTARGARNTRHTTAPVPVSVPIRGEPPDAVRPSIPPRPGTCTATLAALGLCQAASAQPKE